MTAVEHGVEVAGRTLSTADERLGELYARHAAAALRLAFLLTGDRSVAEDLVQEAFIRLIGRLRHLRRPDAFDSYLRRTIVNLSRNRMRRLVLEREEASRDAKERFEPREPDVALEQDLRRALLGLPERQRAAIVLRFYEDLTESEIADVLGCRPSTVRSLVFRGMQVLRTTMGDANDER